MPLAILTDCNRRSFLWKEPLSIGLFFEFVDEKAVSERNGGKSEDLPRIRRRCALSDWGSRCGAFFAPDSRRHLIDALLRPMFVSSWTCVIAGLVATAALSRLLPHPPNCAPVCAFALFPDASLGDRLSRYPDPTSFILITNLAAGGRSTITRGADWLLVIWPPSRFSEHAPRRLRVRRCALHRIRTSGAQIAPRTGSQTQEAFV